MDQAIYVVDEMLAVPGEGRALLERYRTEYMPSAVERGMKLERVLVSPPVWLDEQSNRLLITWTVDSVGAWWGMASQSRYDPSVKDFWQSVSDMIVERQRFFASADGDVEALSDV